MMDLEVWADPRAGTRVGDAERLELDWVGFVMGCLK